MKPLKEFHSDPIYDGDLHRADMAWSKHHTPERLLSRPRHVFDLALAVAFLAEIATVEELGLDLFQGQAAAGGIRRLAWPSLSVSHPPGRFARQMERCSN